MHCVYHYCIQTTTRYVATPRHAMPLATRLLACTSAPPLLPFAHVRPHLRLRVAGNAPFLTVTMEGLKLTAAQRRSPQRKHLHDLGRRHAAPPTANAR
jgi:hypothetical protein